MRLRRLLAVTGVAVVLSAIGALFAPATAAPPSFGSCHVNREYVEVQGEYIVVGGGSGRPIECYY